MGVIIRRPATLDVAGLGLVGDTECGNRGGSARSRTRAGQWRFLRDSLLAAPPAQPLLTGAVEPTMISVRGGHPIFGLCRHLQKDTAETPPHISFRIFGAGRFTSEVKPGGHQEDEFEFLVTSVANISGFLFRMCASQ
jgi:hypothetical protein